MFFYLFVLCTSYCIEPVNYLYTAQLISVHYRQLDSRMCLNHSRNAELINEKYEKLDWTAAENYNVLEDTCAYLDPEIAKKSRKRIMISV